MKTPQSNNAIPPTPLLKCGRAKRANEWTSVRVPGSDLAVNDVVTGTFMEAICELH
jgi:hypothetical protein